MRKPHRILIVEDHRILREGLRSLLSSNPDLEVAGEAADGLEAVRAVETCAPELVLIDLAMPRMDGLDAIREIKNKNPDVKVLVLTVNKAEEYVLAALKAGANGYLLKDATYAELKLGIEYVLSGKTYLSPEVSARMVTSYIEGAAPEKASSSLDTLTQRERQVLKLVAEGYPNRRIADYLCISVKTVEKHRSNLMKKLDLHNASELTSFALEKGLVTR
jgi:DNA-binding NarL/FixJ family response regulator